MPWINKPPKKKKNTEREREKHKLYASREWQSLRKLKLMENPMCEMCQKELATEVHHKVSFMQFQTPELRREHCLYIGLEGLMSLCSDCHHKIHQELKEEKKKNHK